MNVFHSFNDLVNHLRYVNFSETRILDQALDVTGAKLKENRWWPFRIAQENTERTNDVWMVKNEEFVIFDDEVSEFFETGP